MARSRERRDGGKERKDRSRRSKARETILQMLFQMEVQEDFSSEAKDDFLGKYLEDKSQSDFIDGVYEAVCENLSVIDERIQVCSDNWKASRMAKVDLTILRIAAAEIMYMDMIPVSVSANEAVDLAKLYGGEDSSKFVNGILGKLIAFDQTE